MAKVLRTANFHFCDDVINSSICVKEKILELKANRKVKRLSKTWDRMFSEVLSYIDYVKIEMEQLKGATTSEKRKIREILKRCNNNKEEN